METLFGKALGDVANLVKEKWYSAMGLFGLVLLGYTLMFGVPNDDFLVAAFAAALMGIGFGEAETRTFIQWPEVGNGMHYTLTKPIRRLNGPGICLYIVGATAACTAIARAIYLFM